jgi:hypothetical protein
MNILIKGFLCKANIGYVAETAVNRQIAAQRLRGMSVQAESSAKAAMD